ncbi:polyhomeotic-like protein 3 isoform X2 [Alosa sapidissima]|uniref:polyhomeotic-like protein 3 isoform X2 n=1 Tax=Alosa sapidissima TaxID=34773 RepID=UPI001C097325|nr:polyhomeotic-like protein 3 isoform X2 [Alosa sapidissima]
MDRNSLGEMRGATGLTTNTITTPASTSTTLAATNAARPPSPSRTQPLSPTSTDRQAVIQQPVQRSQSTAAQYLQQMYAAQQQHILLQTAALQQQQQVTASQSLTTTAQPSQTVSRPCSSSPPSTNGNLSQSVSVSQTSITLATTPLTAQSIGRIQGTCSTPAGGTISQQAMLLGNGSPAGSQAQMYLRTQMLILAPAASVAAVASDLPAVNPTSSQPTSTQVQSLALRTHLPGALAQGVQLKPCSQGQTVASCLPKMSISPLKSSQLPHASADTSGSDLSQLSTAHQLIAPCPRGTHQLIIQQGAHSAHRQIQPIALRVTAQEHPSPLALQARPLPLPLPPAPAAQSQPPDVLSAASSTSEQQQQPQSAVLVSTTGGSPAQVVRPLLQLGTLGEALPLSPHASAQSYGSITTTAATTNPLPGTLPCPPPASLQRLSLRSVQALAVQSGQMLVSEEELPVAETLVQMPFQNLPPPQTVAVDLKMQSVAQTAPQPAAQGPKMDHKGAEADRDESPSGMQRSRTPTPPTLPPPADAGKSCEEDAPSQRENYTAGLDPPCTPSSQSVIRSPEEPPPVTSSPPPLHPAVVRSTSKPPATSLPESPEGQPSLAVAKPHILTHLIEGFVIHEGLEPFLMSRSSLADEQAALPENQEVTSNGDPDPDDDLMDVDDPENSSNSDMDDMPADDEPLEDSLSDVLQCEFCGKRGYTHSFLRSKRFCSMTCVRRFNVSCTRRLGLLRTDRASRWPPRPMGRRGRPPGRTDGISREHFLRQLPARLDGEEDDEDEPPGPMTTRLRRQAEREREQEEERKERRRRESIGSDDHPVALPNPSQWSVEQVCSYISSIPGCAELAEEFRSQEIDGQALLLLTEDHLVSAMNIKLGPALKICAQINTLKGP